MAKVAERPGSVLLDACANAHHLFIAAPYMKKDALDRVLTGAQSIVSLVCITRWRPYDIMTGASDVACRTVIEARQGSFRLHPSFHAKYYRVDDVIFFGSANLTSSAMGWTDQPNLELICLAGSDFDAHEFEQELLRGSREISDAESALWESLENRSAPEDRSSYDTKLELGSWRPATRDLANLELAYRNRSEEIASLDEKKAAFRDLEVLSIPLRLGEGEFKTWIATCLLATPFANSVLGLQDTNSQKAASALSEMHQLSLTAARRDMETVQNWLLFLNRKRLA